MPKILIPIRGMHCKSCEILIEKNLKKISEIRKANVSHRDGKADIWYEGTVAPMEVIKKAVADAGYEIGDRDKLPWISKNLGDYKNLFSAALILAALYVIARMFGLSELNINTGSDGLVVVFVTGLAAGLSTCMALIGGLVLALSARHAELHPEVTAMQKFRPHIYFNLGRIGGYALFGGIIGYLGSAVKPSPRFLGVLTVIVGGVMVFLGLKLIEIFPVLKNKTLSLPKSVSKLFGINTEAKEYSHKGAIISGALTFFLPCGFTQAMQLYAVSTGSFVQGALIMSLFALGTAWGLLGIGGLSSAFKGASAKKFFAVAGLAVLALGIFNVKNGGSVVFTKFGDSGPVIAENADYQEVKMDQLGGGYSPNVLTVKRGRPVKWIINSTTTYSCASYVVMPKFGISQALQKGENVITFTPTEAGEIPFSCSMGMYRGKFIVIE